MGRKLRALGKALRDQWRFILRRKISIPRLADYEKMLIAAGIGFWILLWGGIYISAILRNVLPCILGLIAGVWWIATCVMVAGELYTEDC